MVHESNIWCVDTSQKSNIQQTARHFEKHSEMSDKQKKIQPNVIEKQVRLFLVESRKNPQTSKSDRDDLRTLHNPNSCENYF